MPMTLEKHRPSDRLWYRDQCTGNNLCTMEKDTSGDAETATTFGGAAEGDRDSAARSLVSGLYHFAECLHL